MRNRKVQQALIKTNEQPISIHDRCGAIDLTPYEAINHIVRKERAELIRRIKAKLDS